MQMIKQDFIYILFLFLLLSFVTGCTRISSEQEAEYVAKSQLEAYSQREGLPSSQFLKHNTSLVEDGWFFEYESLNQPKHLITILVHHDGRAEVSRFVELKN